MMTLWVVIAVIAAAATAFGIVLRRLYWLGPAGLSPALESEILTPTRSAAESYRPMTRLFAEQDFAFLTAFGPQMLQRLLRERRRVLRLYLSELRADFERIYALCRMLAPRSSNPHFAARITQQAFSFYGLLLIVEMRCALGWVLPVRVDTVELVNAVDRLRQAAQASLAPQPVPAG